MHVFCCFSFCFADENKISVLGAAPLLLYQFLAVLVVGVAVIAADECRRSC